MKTKKDKIGWYWSDEMVSLYYYDGKNIYGFYSRYLSFQISGFFSVPHKIGLIYIRGL